MNLLQTILESNKGQIVEQLAASVGIEPAQADSALRSLLPAISGGIKKNTSQSGGVESLLSALSSGQHQQYLQQPSILNESSSVDDGNAILGHLFGSKEVSRNVAGQAAAATGIDVGALKQMLPRVAALAMGALSQQANNTGLLGTMTESSVDPSSSGLDASSIIVSFLDADNDGSMVDDVLGMAKRFF